MMHTVIHNTGVQVSAAAQLKAEVNIKKKCILVMTNEMNSPASVESSMSVQ